jgi:hypothetical protein
MVSAGSSENMGTRGVLLLSNEVDMFEREVRQDSIHAPFLRLGCFSGGPRRGKDRVEPMGTNVGVCRGGDAVSARGVYR